MGAHLHVSCRRDRHSLHTTNWVNWHLTKGGGAFAESPFYHRNKAPAKTSLPIIVVYTCGQRSEMISERNVEVLEVLQPFYLLFFDGDGAMQQCFAGANEQFFNF